MTEKLQSLATSTTTVSQMARAFPQAIAVFDEVDIDYSCKGATPLAAAAAAAGFSLEELIDLVAARQPTGSIGQNSRLLRCSIFSNRTTTTMGSTIPSMGEQIESLVARHTLVSELRRIRSVFDNAGRHRREACLGWDAGRAAGCAASHRGRSTTRPAGVVQRLGSLGPAATVA